MAVPHCRTAGVVALAIMAAILVAAARSMGRWRSGSVQGSNSIGDRVDHYRLWQPVGKAAEEGAGVDDRCTSFGCSALNGWGCVMEEMVGNGHREDSKRRKTALLHETIVLLILLPARIQCSLRSYIACHDRLRKSAAEAYDCTRKLTCLSVSLQCLILSALHPCIPVVFQIHSTARAVSGLHIQYHYDHLKWIVWCAHDCSAAPLALPDSWTYTPCIGATAWKYPGCCSTIGWDRRFHHQQQQ